MPFAHVRLSEHSVLLHTVLAFRTTNTHGQCSAVRKKDFTTIHGHGQCSEEEGLSSGADDQAATSGRPAEAGRQLVWQALMKMQHSERGNQQERQAGGTGR